MNQKPPKSPDGYMRPPTLIIPRLLRIQDVARYLNATTWYVEELIRNRKIRFLVLGKRHVVDVNDLNEWIEDQKKLQDLRNLPILTDEEAQALFDGCQQDEDGNYVIRVFGSEE